LSVLIGVFHSKASINSEMGADLKAVEEAMGAISLFFVHTRDFTRPSVPAALEWLLAKYSLETLHLLWK